MRRKQAQGKQRCSARPKRKCTAPLKTKSSNKGSLKMVDPHCVAKGQKVEGAKTERTTHDEKHAHHCSNSRLLIRGDGDVPLLERGLCPENTCRDPVELEDEDLWEVERRGLEEEESEMKMQIQVDNSIFLDDDSNQVLPVGQFFGNIELVQDYPPRAPASTPMSRREYRRLHYIAKDDSDDDIYEDDHPETPQQRDSFSSTADSGNHVRNGSRGLATQKEV
uniref:Uncharacterized protein n=1 Tax=Anguilla anguilla TaxID=7936 RepID=A0A0E9X5Q4_ANGAN